MAEDKKFWEHSPNNITKTFGPEVTLDSVAMEPDAWANNMVREVGKTIGPQGLTYKGSVVVHYYAHDEDSSLVMVNKTASIVTQILGKKTGQGLSSELREGYAVFGLSDLTLKLRNHYSGHEHKTTNKKDKR